MSAPVPHTLVSSLTLLRDPTAPCPCILTDQLTSAIPSHLCLLSVPVSPTHTVRMCWGHGLLWQPPRHPKQWLVKGLTSGKKELIHCARQGGSPASLCHISGDSHGPGTSTSALCRSQELDNPRLPGSGWGIRAGYSTLPRNGEAIKDTCSPQDLCSCSVLPDGLVQSRVDVT